MGTIDSTLDNVDALVRQLAQVLAAGGTVYLGEDHSKPDARYVCRQLLDLRRVQYLCLEIAPDAMEGMTDEELRGHEMMFPHKNLVKLGDLILRCREQGGTDVPMDAPFGSNSSKRQPAMVKSIKRCRTRITAVGRGVLVLVGSDHLKKTNVFGEPLHEQVYGGLSFFAGEFGKSKGDCNAFWQLS